MTIQRLLEELKVFIQNAVDRFSLPTAVQKGDEKQQFRAPDVHKMRLPNSRHYSKKAPYIIVQFVNSIDRQSTAQNSEAGAVMRMIFCVYDENEEDGATTLVGVMEAVRIALMKTISVDDCFQLDREKGLEMLVYNEDSAPYYAGEMIGTFIIPEIEREVRLDG